MLVIAKKHFSAKRRRKGLWLVHIDHIHTQWALFFVHRTLFKDQMYFIKEHDVYVCVCLRGGHVCTRNGLDAVASGYVLEYAHTKRSAK